MAPPHIISLPFMSPTATFIDHWPPPRLFGMHILRKQTHLELAILACFHVPVVVKFVFGFKVDFEPV